MSQHPLSRPSTANWENEGGSVCSSETEALGITRVMTERFTVGGYAYSKLADAVAQARRMQEQDGRREPR
jgi:hypothetical protein